MLILTMILKILKVMMKATKVMNDDIDDDLEEIEK